MLWRDDIDADLAQRMFKLSDIDHASSEMSTEQEDLEFILKSSVPGLISDSHRVKGAIISDTNQLQDNSATGHRLLVEPNVFNMGLLLPPSLSFIQRLKEIVPPGYALARRRSILLLTLAAPTSS